MTSHVADSGSKNQSDRKLRSHKYLMMIFLIWPQVFKSSQQIKFNIEVTLRI